jgi:hypothetical protein
MKRIIAAALLACMTVPAFAASGGATASGGIPGFREGMPYSQLEVDRALPNVKDPVVAQPRQFAGPATGGYSSTEASGPWANDWNFIAPSE